MESDLTVEIDSAACDECESETAPAESSHSDKPKGEKRSEGKGPDRRLDRVERRVGIERRHATAEKSGYTGPERREPDERRTGLERRRGAGRRLSDERKSAEEGEMSQYQFEFVMAIQTYKKLNKRMYPTWTEILEILHQLGYRKVLKRKIRLDVPEPELTQL